MSHTALKNSNLSVLSLLGFCLLSFVSSAQADHSSETEERLFTIYEANGEDYIQGIGIGFSNVNPESKLGFEFSTSFNNAEVRTTDGFIENYFAWQGTARFGLFSNLSIYAELGVDLTELLFQDFRYEIHDDYYNEYHDDIDAFVGVGAGLKAGPLRVEAFSRLREIDSRFWEAEAEVFTGLQASISL